jgi:hypothetical protein
MSRRFRLFCLFVAASAAFAASARGAEVTAELSKEEDRVTVKIDGELFAEYLTQSGTKPIVWPIIGPTGKAMTRSWPMGKQGPSERADHIHQRSLWFTHGDVNGVDFWAEKAEDSHPLGSIKHRKFVKISGGPQAVINTQNDWLSHEQKNVCEDDRTLTFGVVGPSRFIDFDITISAPDNPVTFGDTKEGSWGIRMAATMQPDAKLGGRLINSEGLTGDDAWGKPAAWVDYFGPVEGETVGLAMMNHPSSFRYPTPWHARGYGLCAANPFGLKNFDEKAASGAYTIPRGKSIALRYRLLLHKGNVKDGEVAEVFSDYAKQAK